MKWGDTWHLLRGVYGDKMVDGGTGPGARNTEGPSMAAGTGHHSYLPGCQALCKEEPASGPRQQVGRDPRALEQDGCPGWVSALWVLGQSPGESPAWPQMKILPFLGRVGCH